MQLFSPFGTDVSCLGRHLNDEAEAKCQDGVLWYVFIMFSNWYTLGIVSDPYE